MINGHGDDTYKYEGIRINFSSNIYAHADITPLVEHLRGEIGRICNYPEPEALTLEAKIAEKKGLKIEELFLELCQKCTNINCKNKLILEFD